MLLVGPTMRPSAASLSTALPIGSVISLRQGTAYWFTASLRCLVSEELAGKFSLFFVVSEPVGVDSGIQEGAPH